MTTHRFEAVLGADVGGRPAVVLPADVAAAMGGRARIPVAGTINGVPFRGSTMPLGDGRHCVGFRKDTRAAAGAAEMGDRVAIEIRRDEAPRTVAVPDDLAAALALEPQLRAAFDAMSYTHRREWVEALEDAKRPETRAKRIAQAVQAARATRDARRMGAGLRRAGPGDLDALTAIMATAFRNDPVWGEYSYPGSRERLDTAATVWRAYLSALIRHGWSFLSPGGESAAVWVPPGERELTDEQERELEALLHALLGDAQAAIVLDAFARLDAAHPLHEPHHHLSLFGTHEDHRGRGIGMALLDACLKRVDAAGTPAYLESTNPANDRRYMSRGFEPFGRVELAGGPVVTTMWRPARPSA